jgi:hypothetical protein
MHAGDQPKLLFTEVFDERLAFEVEQKGWCSIGIVELPSGTQIKVFFYDPVRLAQDLETDLASGEVCIAEVGMIVIPKITREYMEKAVHRLFKKGFFNNFVPV